MRWIGHISCMDEIRNAYSISVRKHKEKIQLGRLRIILTYTLKIGQEGVCWVNLAHNNSQ
jgi:hypothetical protein